MVENGLYKTPFNAGKVLFEAAPSIDTGSMIFSGTDVGLFWQAFSLPAFGYSVFHSGYL